MSRIKTTNLGKTEEYVYDINLDGTVVNALGMNVAHNTDGFNFAVPKKYRYTKEHPYISNGAGRKTVKGKEYYEAEADVAEFNDTYFNDRHYHPDAQNKMLIEIDERLLNSLNISRKNYIDDYDGTGKYKFVGNSVKSKKTPIYIEKALNLLIPFLMQDRGKEFIDNYYDYIEKIYNYQIPLKDIATKGKIKKSVKEYLEDVSQLTKAGRPKARQAWYELAIRDNLIVDNGDTVYYINTGTSKSHSDVKRVTHVYMNDENGEKVEITRKIESEFGKYKKQCAKDGVKYKEKSVWVDETFPNRFTEDEITLNCVTVPIDIVESEYDIFSCDRGIEYNVPKYIEAFNKKIHPLLVCFNKGVRDNILIDNPKDRKYFTEDECYLTSGEPFKPTQQDSYEDLMKFERKEIAFWTKYNMEPPFVKECQGVEWSEIVRDYEETLKREREIGIDKVREEYSRLCEGLTEEEIEAILDEGELPKNFNKIVSVDPMTGDFLANDYPDVVIGKLSDIIDLIERRRYNSTLNGDSEEVKEE